MPTMTKMGTGIALPNAISRCDNHLPIVNSQILFLSGSRFGSCSVRDYGKPWNQLPCSCSQKNHCSAARVCVVLRLHSRISTWPLPPHVVNNLGATKAAFAFRLRLHPTLTRTQHAKAQSRDTHRHAVGNRSDIRKRKVFRSSHHFPRRPIHCPSTHPAPMSSQSNQPKGQRHQSTPAVAGRPSSSKTPGKDKSKRDHLAGNQRNSQSDRDELKNIPRRYPVPGQTQQAEEEPTQIAESSKYANLSNNQLHQYANLLHRKIGSSKTPTNEMAIDEDSAKNTGTPSGRSKSAAPDDLIDIEASDEDHPAIVGPNASISVGSDDDMGLAAEKEPPMAEKEEAPSTTPEEEEEESSTLRLEVCLDPACQRRLTPYSRR